MNDVLSCPQNRGLRPAARRRPLAAFTMVEIALCLGILAFALVAILGVMPTGLRVQQENRQDTILNQDGLYLLEAIRSGAIGLDQLTNHVLAIAVTNQVEGQLLFFNPYLLPTGRIEPFGPLRTAVPGRGVLTNGVRIVGVLSRPKWQYLNGVPVTNHITALIRSLSGSVIQRSVVGRELAFTYLATPELVPLGVNPHYYPPDLTNFTAVGLSVDDYTLRSNRWAMLRNQAANFAELRLTLQGPAFLTRENNVLRWDAAAAPKALRTIVGGQRAPVEFQNDLQYMANLVQPTLYKRETP